MSTNIHENNFVFNQEGINELISHVVEPNIKKQTLGVYAWPATTGVPTAFSDYGIGIGGIWYVGSRTNDNIYGPSTTGAAINGIPQNSFVFGGSKCQIKINEDTTETDNTYKNIYANSIKLYDTIEADKLKISNSAEIGNLNINSNGSISTSGYIAADGDITGKNINLNHYIRLTAFPTPSTNGETYGANQEGLIWYQGHIRENTNDTIQFGATTATGVIVCGEHDSTKTEGNYKGIKIAAADFYDTTQKNNISNIYGKTKTKYTSVIIYHSLQASQNANAQTNHYNFTYFRADPLDDQFKNASKEERYTNSGFYGFFNNTYITYVDFSITESGYSEGLHTKGLGLSENISIKDIIISPYTDDDSTIDGISNTSWDIWRNNGIRGYAYKRINNTNNNILRIFFAAESRAPTTSFTRANILIVYE